MAEAASTLLVSNAAEISQAIFLVSKQGHLTPSDLDSYRIANSVAVRLHLISTYLESLPPYWIEPEVEQLCHTILRDLQAISRPIKRPSYLASPFILNRSTDLKRCLTAFFRIQKDDARNLEVACNDLLSGLTKDDNVTVELPNCAVQLDSSDCSDGLADGAFDALQLIALCEPASHGAGSGAAAAQQDIEELRHLARLCLHEPEDQDLTLLVSATDMAAWQEFCLRDQVGDTMDDDCEALERGGFCPILEMDYTARLFLVFKLNRGFFLRRETELLNQIFAAGPGVSLKGVLRDYELTPKDKVILSYAVALSYWKYYNSELMRIKWSSDTIWFMSEEVTNGHKDQLPLRAYLSLPFGAVSSIESDIIYEDLLTHRCPRIFDLAVLLLEIGLAKPFQTPKRRNMVGQANFNHKRAIDELLELKKVGWSGFTDSKKYFDWTVNFCLTSENFVPPKYKRTRQGLIGSTSESEGQAGILRRRRILHKNVVRPLAWLAKSGFQARSGDLTYVGKKPSPLDTSLIPETEELFHSNIVPKLWLADLKRISEHVEHTRRQCRVTTPVRVAILDTGFNEDFPSFKAKGLIKSITEKVDFVKPSASDTMDDTFGHGTFMASLIMECAPSVEILVARVAENTSALHNSHENIKKAILWAGQTGKADIISMSFGFPRDDQGIRDAIDAVYKDRGEDVIFFASAGNSSTDDESFPARHPNVIAVYAMDCHGTFLRSNPTSTTNGAAVLSTYGDDIPEFMYEQFKTTYPSVCQPGSSVATAVMAGIGATILAYASVLPSLVRLEGVAANIDRVFKHLRTAKGMEAVLRRLAQKDVDHPRLNAVKPMWFWKNKPSHTERWIAICDVLSDVDRRRSQ